MFTNWDDTARASLVLATGVLMLLLFMSRVQTIDNLREDHCLMLAGDRALPPSDDGDVYPVASGNNDIYHFTTDCDLDNRNSQHLTPIDAPPGWTIGERWPDDVERVEWVEVNRLNLDDDGTVISKLPFSVTRSINKINVAGGGTAVVAFDGQGGNARVEAVDRMAFFDRDRGGMLALASEFVWSFFLAGFAIALLCLFVMELRGAPWDE